VSTAVTAPSPCGCSTSVGVLLHLRWSYPSARRSPRSSFAREPSIKLGADLIYQSVAGADLLNCGVDHSRTLERKEVYGVERFQESKPSVAELLVITQDVA